MADPFDTEAEPPKKRKRGTDAIERMNAEYAIAWAGGDAVIIREHRDPSTGRSVTTFIKDAAAKTMLANQFVSVDGENGQVSRKPIFPYWLASKKRRQYEGVIFEPWAADKSPMSDPRYYNLFRGWAVQPDPRGADGCGLFLDHLLNVICGGNADDARWLTAWLAQAVREPESRPGTAPVLRGDQGLGKGLPVQYVGRLWGESFVHLAKKDDLLGRFNAHTKDALLIFADEVIFGGDRRSLGVLNAIITEESVMIEPKFKDKLRVRNHMRLIMSTNESWAVPVDHDARRFFMPTISAAHAGDRAYFDALANEMNNGGPACLLAYLLAFDYSGIDLRSVPKTAELARQKHLSLSSGQKFWFEHLNAGELVQPEQMTGDNTSWADGPIFVSKRAMADTYLKHAIAANDRYRDTPQILWSRIDETCRGPNGEQLIKRSSNKRSFSDPNRLDRDGFPLTYLDRFVQFPPLADCRRAFERWARQPISWEVSTDMTLPELGPQRADQGQGDDGRWL
jgi:hypothetical protein